jgi:hypothetical protein
MKSSTCFAAGRCNRDCRLSAGLRRAYLPVQISAGLIEHAGDLARVHALRSYDAVQPAAALEVRTKIP